MTADYGALSICILCLNEVMHNLMIDKKKYSLIILCSSDSIANGS